MSTRRSPQSKTESLFENWSEYVVQHRWIVLLVVALVTAAVLPQLRNITIDISIESYLSETDPSVADYNDYREEFGYGSEGLVTVETENLFTLENLARLKSLHDDLETGVPYIEKITSLVNVRHTRGENNALIINDLFEIWPQSESEMAAFRTLVLNNPVYRGNLVSETGLLASIVIEPHSYSSISLDDLSEASAFEEIESETTNSASDHEQYLTPDEEAEFVLAMMTVQEKHSADDFKIHISGLPVVNYRLSADLGNSMGRNMLIGFAVIALLLVVLFRRISGVLLPLLVVLLSFLMTLALMPVMGLPINGNTQILPSFLLAVGIADAVHILSVFYKRYDAGEDKKSAITGAMKTTAIAVVMTSVTTAAGLISFGVADLMPVRALGFCGSIGTILALFYTVALIPALLAVLPIKRHTVQQETDTRGSKLLALIDGWVYNMGDFGVRQARPVLAITIAATIFSIFGLSQVKLSHDPIRWYNEDHPIRIASETVDAEMSGTQTFQVVFDTHQENGLHDPKMMKILEESKIFIEGFRHEEVQAKNAVSLLSVVKETHKALNGGLPEFYRIPDQRETIAQELLLFENSDPEDIEGFTDASFRVARLSIAMPWSNAIYYEGYVDTMQENLDRLIAESGLQNVTVKIVGVTVIFAHTLQAMLSTMVKSYALALFLVGLLMFLLMGSVRRGILAFAPNVVPIIFTVGMMGWMGIPLNMLTSVLGCIIIGISVDDTIHFMHHFRRISDTEADPQIAVHLTLETVGRAITFTSIVLVGGFFVNLFDIFSSARAFGILMCFSIIVAWVANLVLAPALMTLFWDSENHP